MAKKNKKKSSFWADFKKFITRGNVIDMAVGVVVGGAFGKIVTSLVNDIIMPLIGTLTGGVSVSDLKYVLTEAVLDEAGTVLTPENAIRYGAFIQFVIDFLIIALAVFVFVKVLNSAKNLRKKEEVVEESPAPAPEPEPSKEEVLLAEIRDILKQK